MRIRLLSLLLLTTIFISCQKQNVSPWVKGFRVINNGVGGNTTNDLLKRMDDVYKNKPGLVILMIGTNDANSLTLPAYTTNLNNIVSLLKSHGMAVLLLSPPPRGTTALVYPNAKNERTDAEVKAMDSISVAQNTFYLDMNAAFKAEGTPNDTGTSLINNAVTTPKNPDGIHPTPAGYQFIATEVFNFMIDNNLLHYKIISCFGDSITAGPYPGLLLKLLNKTST